MLNLFQYLGVRDPETILKQVQHKIQGDKFILSSIISQNFLIIGLFFIGIPKHFRIY